MEPNHVYVILPNTALEIFHGKLQLTTRDSKVLNLPKFYSKKSIASPLHMDFTTLSFIEGSTEDSADIEKKYEMWNGVDLQQKADRLIMQKYVPAAVLVDEQMEILQFRGHTGRYLEPVPEKPV